MSALYDHENILYDADRRKEVWFVNDFSFPGKSQRP